MPSLSEQARATDPVYQKFFGPKNLRLDGITYVPPEDGLVFQSDGYPHGPASGMRVLGIASDMQACGHFRIIYPLRHLANQGAAVKVYTLTKDNPLPIGPLFESDYIILQRSHDAQGLTILNSIKESGSKATIIYDIDDYLDGISSRSPAAKLYTNKTTHGVAVLQGVHRYLAESDGVIGSTRELLGLYKQITQPYLFQNGLDLTLGERDWSLNGPRTDWREVANNQGCKGIDSNSLLFGFSGGKTHLPDLDTLGNAVAQILRRVPHAYFGLQLVPDVAFQLIVNTWRLPLDRVVYISPVPFQEYPKSLNAFDVALCPLENTAFNRAKSSLRLLEFGAWGVPYVASKVAPFQRFHTESGGIGGALVRTTDEWVSASVNLLTNHALRQQRGALLQNYVRTQCDISQTYAELSLMMKAIRTSALSGIALRDLVSVADQVQSKAYRVPRMERHTPCPCGSGKKYLLCGCYPAWGRI